MIIDDSDDAHPLIMYSRNSYSVHQLEVAKQELLRTVNQLPMPKEVETGHQGNGLQKPVPIASSSRIEQVNAKKQGPISTTATATAGTNKRNMESCQSGLDRKQKLISSQSDVNQKVRANQPVANRNRKVKSDQSDVKSKPCHEHRKSNVDAKVDVNSDQLDISQKVQSSQSGAIREQKVKSAQLLVKHKQSVTPRDQAAKFNQSDSGSKSIQKDGQSTASTKEDVKPGQPVTSNNPREGCNQSEVDSKHKLRAGQSVVPCNSNSQIRKFPRLNKRKRLSRSAKSSCINYAEGTSDEEDFTTEQLNPKTSEGHSKSISQSCSNDVHEAESPAQNVSRKRKSSASSDKCRKHSRQLPTSLNKSMSTDVNKHSGISDEHAAKLHSETSSSSSASNLHTGKKRRLNSVESSSCEVKSRKPDTELSRSSTGDEHCSQTAKERKSISGRGSLNDKSVKKSEKLDRSTRFKIQSPSKTNSCSATLKRPSRSQKRMTKNSCNDSDLVMMTFDGHTVRIKSGHKANIEWV